MEEGSNSHFKKKRTHTKRTHKRPLRSLLFPYVTNAFQYGEEGTNQNPLKLGEARGDSLDKRHKPFKKK